MRDEGLPGHVRVLVVGAGFGGLGMAVGLHERGLDDFLLVERGPDVGGTWRDNTYPGAACDVPSQLYSFSWAPNPDWTRSYSPQPEIWAYLRGIARRTGVLERVAFDTTLVSATWDADAAQWCAETSRGEVRADVLVTATGGLSEPRMPDIEGLGSFTGELFHTARWDHDYDLSGKRVAVVGTGASAIQVVPAIAPTVGHLDVYQRTAPWVVPRNDRAYGSLERAALRHVPGVRRLYRSALYWGREALVPAVFVNPRVPGVARRGAMANIERSISDPVLREKVTPHFQIGCKRILVSNDWYPTLARDDVDLVTSPIARFTERGIVTEDGTAREVDAVVVATGFHTIDLPIAEHVVGAAGESLRQVWDREGVAAYKGTTVRGFPNLFQIVGPNTGLGHSSMVFVIECQIRYILDALAHMTAEGVTSVQPTARAQRRWNADLQRRLARTVWNTGGCTSWYLDRHGRNPVLWPRSTVMLRRELARFDPAAYEPATGASDSRTATRKVAATT